MQRVTTPAFGQLGEQYAGLPKRPLRVTAHLDDAVITYTKSVHFDGLLAYAVVMRATGGVGLPDSMVYDLPLPMEVLWRDARGLPLWATTDLVPVSKDVIASRDYFHRRSLTPMMTERNLDTGAGKHKEKRSPLPTLRASIWQADCIGHAETISDLLSAITSIGKKANTHGAVQAWQVEDIDRFDVIDEDGRARRVLPVQYVYPDAAADLSAHLLGWTPPYWIPSTRAFCYDTGQDV
jgi:hypothetical protein